MCLCRAHIVVACGRQRNLWAPLGDSWGRSTGAALGPAESPDSAWHCTGRGLYRSPRVVALELLVWARSPSQASLGPRAWWQSW
eukprot:579033-Amphidinium_carterae.1